jgi:hypothetical protein
MIFAYFGPETLLPITSMVAGVAGVLMVLGKNTFRFLGPIWSGLCRSVGIKRHSTVPPPHVSTSATSASSALERRRAKARSSQGQATEVRDAHGQ